MDIQTISKIESSLHMMTKAFRAGFKKSDIMLDDHLLSRSQKEVVGFIYEQKSVSIKDIATHLELTSSAATQLVDALVEKEILKRHEKELDRRVVEVSFTDKFAIKMIKLKEIRYKIIQDLFADVTEAEIENIAKVAEKISNKVKN